jgi:hypothetical protein
MYDFLDPRFAKEPLLTNKVINTSVFDDDGKEIACLITYSFEDDNSNRYVRDLDFKVLGSYNAPEEIILEQVKDEIIKFTFKTVIFP